MVVFCSRKKVMEMKELFAILKKSFNIIQAVDTIVYLR